MPDDRFFTSVVLQLMNPPHSSLDALSAAQRKPPSTPPSLEFEIDSARSWAQTILQNTFQPQGKDPFVTFPSEGGRFDVIRCAYRAGGVEIFIAESKYVISITLADGRLGPQKSDREMAENVARKIMTMSERIRFNELGMIGNARYGRQDVDAMGRVDRAWPHWLDTLRWWSGGNALGFVTLKASGGPTRAVISVDDQANRRWF